MCVVCYIERNIYFFYQIEMRGRFNEMRKDECSGDKSFVGVA